MGKRNTKEPRFARERFFVCEERERESVSASASKMQAIGGRRANFVRGGVVGSVRTSPNQGRVARGGRLSCNASLKDIRDRIGSVKNTQKITDAMKLVAAAKVRRAQDAHLRQTLRLQARRHALRREHPPEERERGRLPALGRQARREGPRRRLHRGQGTLRRLQQLHSQENRAARRGAQGHRRRGRAHPRWKEGRTVLWQEERPVRGRQVLRDGPEAHREGVPGHRGRHLLQVRRRRGPEGRAIYTKFVSLISSDPIVQTLLPMTPEGEVCDIEGNCIDAADDELFLLTTKEGELAVERETTNIADGEGFDELLIFEQEPQQILDALLPLYMNGTVLRALQESLASELAARMNAMNSASDNAKELKKNLTLQYNRGRQAKITGEIIEICAGASAAS